MIEFVNNLINFSINNFQSFSYGIVFLAALLETVIIIGLFLPGSSIVLLLGALSAQGYGNIWLLFLFATAGAVLGDNINYYFGKRYGSEWLKNGFWILNKKHFIKAKKFFNKHGAKSVFLGRFIPSIKEIVPLIAGTFKMDKNRFFLWNVLGAIGWGIEWLLLGYVFGQSLGSAKSLIFKVGIVAIILLIFFMTSSSLFSLIFKKIKFLQQHN